ncbi:MAG: hypothetical protein Ct9H300mP25_06120 [Acidobacteriota bacterium]|nr:MAG: hypothetical protein Ct9H300mP25_06120 [Acidobacteriota bacterium]
MIFCSNVSEMLLERLRTASTESFDARCYVDTGPIQERVYAQYGGLGGDWQEHPVSFIRNRGAGFFCRKLLRAYFLMSIHLSWTSVWDLYFMS